MVTSSKPASVMSSNASDPGAQKKGDFLYWEPPLLFMTDADGARVVGCRQGDVS